ncbi:MAG: hypothetical protein AB1345_11705, partial [Chloroflexota bacterium]
MSGSMWQGMKTRHGDGTEALSQEMESNGSATPKSRRHPLTLLSDRGCPEGPLRGGSAAFHDKRRGFLRLVAGKGCSGAQPPAAHAYVGQPVRI